MAETINIQDFPCTVEKIVKSSSSSSSRLNINMGEDTFEQYAKSCPTLDVVEQNIIKFFSTADENDIKNVKSVKTLDAIIASVRNLLKLDISEAVKNMYYAGINLAISILKSPYTIPKSMLLGFMGAPLQFKIFFIVSFALAVQTIKPLITKSDVIFTTNPPDFKFPEDPIEKKIEEDKITYRMGQRATFASLISSVFMGTFNFAIDSVLNVSGATSTAFIGFLLGNTFGYILDLIFSTEEGFRMVMDGDWVGATRRAFGMLASGTFTRFMLTVLLDTFISSILFTILYEYLKDRFVWAQENESFVNAMLSSTIGIITFQVYTNKTRLFYAYPDKSVVDQKNTMSSGLLAMSTILAGLVFLITPKMFKFYKSDDGKTFSVIPKYGVEGVENPIVKLYMVMGTILIMMVMYTLKSKVKDSDVELSWLEPQTPLEPSKTETWVGRLIFGLIAVGTVWMTTKTAQNKKYVPFFTFTSLMIAGVPIFLG